MARPQRTPCAARIRPDLDLTLALKPSPTTRLCRWRRRDRRSGIAFNCHVPGLSRRIVDDGELGRGEFQEFLGVLALLVDVDRDDRKPSARTSRHLVHPRKERLHGQHHEAQKSSRDLPRSFSRATSWPSALAARTLAQSRLRNGPTAARRGVPTEKARARLFMTFIVALRAALASTWSPMNGSVAERVPHARRHTCGRGMLNGEQLRSRTFPGETPRLGPVHTNAGRREASRLPQAGEWNFEALSHA